VGYIFDGNKAKISLLPRKIEKLSFVWCQIQDPDHFLRKSGIESITEIFPHLTEVSFVYCLWKRPYFDDYGACCYSSHFGASGAWLWSSGIKKVILKGSSFILGVGFPTGLQKCLVESLDLPDLTNFLVKHLRQRFKPAMTITGLNMPLLRELSLRHTDKETHGKLSDEGLAILFDVKSGIHSNAALKNVEVLDVRGTAVTGRGLLTIIEHFPALRELKLQAVL